MLGCRVWAVSAAANLVGLSQSPQCSQSPHKSCIKPFQGWKYKEVLQERVSSPDIPLNPVDERHRKDRTQPWLFPYAAALGMLHHVSQPCLGGGLNPNTWTIAFQVAPLQKETPSGSKEGDRDITAGEMQLTSPPQLP